MPDAWNPAQYDRFKTERTQPFYDLLSLVRSKAAMRVVDLGCGTGRLTRQMHDSLKAAETLGIDNSANMLAEASALAGEGLRFEQSDIGDFQPILPFNLVFSNAAVQWVDDHEALFPRLAAAVAPGGQLAVQMPANFDQASHLAAEEVAGREPYRSVLGAYVKKLPILSIERYAQILFDNGFSQQQVRMQVYPHVLPSAEDVVEWTKGTLLTGYQSRLSPATFESFIADYRITLLSRVNDSRPFFFPFKRILIWAMR